MSLDHELKGSDEVDHNIKDAAPPTERKRKHTLGRFVEKKFSVVSRKFSKQQDNNTNGKIDMEPVRKNNNVIEEVPDV